MVIQDDQKPDLRIQSIIIADDDIDDQLLFEHAL